VGAPAHLGAGNLTNVAFSPHLKCSRCKPGWPIIPGSLQQDVLDHAVGLHMDEGRSITWTSQRDSRSTVEMVRGIRVGALSHTIQG
jgi:hypothetical protein